MRYQLKVISSKNFFLEKVRMYVHAINYFRKSIIMKKNCISNVNSEIVLSTYLPKRKCRLTTGYTTRVFSAEVDTF